MITLNIVGCGRAARTLARLWQQAGVLRIGDVCNNTLASAAAACAFIGAGRPVAAVAQMREAALWMLGVPDSAIVPAATALDEAQLLRAGDGVFHLSGFTASSALGPLAGRGARSASLHPVVSFADPTRTAGVFGGSLCGLEGDAALCAELEVLVAAIGGRAFPLDAGQKPLYHAASVFASNFQVVIQDLALKAYLQSGVPADVAATLHAGLARGALENVLALGGAAALTGPAARGDREVVAYQQAVVSDWDAAAGEAYAALSALAFRLAAERPG